MNSNGREYSDYDPYGEPNHYAFPSDAIPFQKSGLYYPRMPCFSSLPRKDSSLLSRSCSSACSLSYEVEPSDEYLYVQPPLPAYAPRQSPATIPPYSSYSNPVLLPRVRSSEESNHRPFSSTSDSVSPFPPLPPEELQTSMCLSPPAKQPVPPKSVPVASPPRSHLESHEAIKEMQGQGRRRALRDRSSARPLQRRFAPIPHDQEYPQQVGAGAGIKRSILQDRLLFILEQFVRYQIEFLYLPIDRTTECNLGYGYVSLVDSRAVLTLYQAVGCRRRIPCRCMASAGQTPPVSNSARLCTLASKVIVTM